MSLFKQLWLAILGLLGLVLMISVIVTTLSARNYLAQQLSIQNADNATALALSLTKQGGDAVLLELTLAAQFDTGHYELIELTDPAGHATIRRVAEVTEPGAPAWFMRLFPIEVKPGIATIQSGWQQAGTLTLRSQSRFAYQELWQNTLLLSLTCALAGLLAGLLGTAFLRRVLRPLAEVVDQAEAIGNRRFITNTREPKTLEFRRVIGAMNELSDRIKSMLAQEAQRLQQWQRDTNVDAISGLYNRDAFLSALEAALQSNDDNSAGTLCIIRMTNLGQLNQAFGRKATDNLLQDIGSALNRFSVQQHGWNAGRLNGSDFAIQAPRELDASALGRRMQQAMLAVLDDYSMREQVLLPGGTTIYQHRDALTELLNRTDTALISAERENVSAITQAYPGDIPTRPVREQVAHWQDVLTQAMQAGDFSLAQFPVVKLDNQLLHYEAPVRLQYNGEQWNAGRFVPWVHRVQLAGELDKQVLTLALSAIEQTGQPLAINLSVDAIANSRFLNWAEEPMRLHRRAMDKLWIEIPEAVAFRYLDNFKRLATRIQTHGGRVGIEHIGHQLAKLGELHDVGLDYLKIDASFVRAIPQRPGNQTLLRALCTLGHTMGVMVIAEGVANEAEWSTLRNIGIDGATGPGIKLAD